MARIFYYLYTAFYKKLRVSDEISNSATFHNDFTYHFFRNMSWITNHSQKIGWGTVTALYVYGFKFSLSMAHTHVLHVNINHFCYNPYFGQLRHFFQTLYTMAKRGIIIYLHTVCCLLLNLLPNSLENWSTPTICFLSLTVNIS